jgi:hypothetical protein
VTFYILESRIQNSKSLGWSPALVIRTRSAVRNLSTYFGQSAGSLSPNLPADQSVPRILTHAAAISQLRIPSLTPSHFLTEAATLDPLAKSVTQFLRLLLEESAVRLCEVRSREELAVWWASNGPAYTHVIFVGHGASNGVQFGVDGLTSAADFGGACAGGVIRKR